MAGAEQQHRRTARRDLLLLGERFDVFDVSRVKDLDPEIDPAAAALAEVGAERERALFHCASSCANRLTRVGERPPFQFAAANGAMESAGRAHDHHRTRVARRRALRRLDAHQSRGALGAD